VGRRFLRDGHAHPEVFAALVAWLRATMTTGWPPSWNLAACQKAIRQRHSPARLSFAITTHQRRLAAAKHPRPAS